MGRAGIVVLALSALFASPSIGVAQETDLADAIRAIDVPSLQDVAGSSAASPTERALAEGVLAALRRDDETAAAQLLASVENPVLSADLRRAAWLTLFTVRYRQGRYEDAVAAMDAADALGAESDPARALSNAQARALAAVLADAPAMQVSELTSGEIPLRRDRLQLVRANADINGHGEEVVIDTGASISAMSESAAVRAGLSFLGSASAGTASQADMPFRVAVARQLALGGVTFENVVFAVYPDDALKFLGGAYTIDAIIGLPVLIELGRIEFRTEGAAETMRYGPSLSGREDKEPNLLLNGFNPLVLVSVAGADAPLVMMLDSGSSASGLTPLAVEDHPELLRNVEQRPGTMAGVGGEAAVDVHIIPRIVFSIAGVDVPLVDVRVAPVARDVRHGLVGQDILRGGGGYALDFQSSHFELLTR